jgi:hypothetical protein
MSTVSRRARLIDLGALACIVAGAALCLLAGARLTDIGKLSYTHPGPRNQSALEAADRARYLAYGGVALVFIGCGVAVAGAIGHSRRKTAERVG